MKILKLGLLIAVVFSLSACTDKGTATRILEAEGIKNIEMTGYDFWSCSNDDFYHTGFKGIKNGKVIRGTVCTGLFFRGSTIRYK